MSFSDIRRLNSHSLYAKTSNTPDNYLLLLKFFIGCIFGFQKHKTEINIFWIFIFLILSSYVTYKYFFFKPYSNSLIMKLIFIEISSLNYSLLILCFLYLIKESNFNGGIILFFIGEFTIILYFYFLKLEHPELNLTLLQPYQINSPDLFLMKLNLLLSFINLNESDRYNNLLLYSYIDKTEDVCVVKECSLKKFIKSNYTKISYFYDHLEHLFLYGIREFPDNCRIRLNYIHFLIFRLKKFQKAKIELDKFISNPRNSINEDFNIFEIKKISESSYDIIKNQNIKNNLNSFNILDSSSLDNLKLNSKKNIFKTNIIEIVSNYIMFWNLLISSHKDIVSDLGKLAEIGNKISSLNDEIKILYNELKKSNLIDRNLLKYYFLYQRNVLNNTDFKYDKNKLEQIENNESETNDLLSLQENIEEEQLNINQERKIIIISSKIENIGNILNISLSACNLFGFTKEEIIGKNINILIPEIFQKIHTNLLINKSNEISHKIINEGKKQVFNKIMDQFGIDKARYLIPITMKMYNLNNEKGEFSFISSFKSFYEDDICYVLTNKFFQIQYFTVNSIRFLGLNGESVNGNNNILNYIKQFNELILKKKLEYSDLNIKKTSFEIKKDIIKDFKKPQNIFWKKRILDNKKVIINQKSFLKNSSTNASNLTVKNFNKKLENEIGLKIDNNNNSNNNSLNNISINNTNQKLSNNKSSSKFLSMEKSNETEKEKKKDLYKISLINLNYIINNNNNSNKSNENIKLESFDLSIDEVEINNKIYGYIFKFTKKVKNSSLNSSIEKEERRFSKITIKKNLSINKIKTPNSENQLKKVLSSNNKLSLPENINNNNFNINGNFIPDDKKSFFIDIQKMVFFQNKNNKNIIDYENEIKKMAVDFFEKNDEKNNDNNNSFINSSELSSYTSYYDSSNSNCSSSSITNKINFENSIKNHFLNNNNNDNNNNNNNNNNDNLYFENYYHVNLNNIHLSIFNFNKQICIETKRKELISDKVKEKIEEEKNFILSNLISLQNIKNKKLKKSISIRTNKEQKLISKDINLTYNSHSKENSPNSLKKQIKYYLKKKDTQGSVLCLRMYSNFIFLFLIFQLVILTIYYLKFLNDFEIFKQILISSDKYLKHLVLGTFKIRELILCSNEKYTNTLGLTREEYFYLWQKSLSISFKELFESQLFIDKYSYFLNKKSYSKIFNQTSKCYYIDNKFNLKEFFVMKSTIISYIYTAMWNIQEFPLFRIIPSDRNVFIYMTNSLKDHLNDSKEESEIIRKDIINFFKRTLISFFVCILIFWIGDFILFFGLKFIFHNVIVKKESYVQIFFNIEGKLIMDSLNKCEKFLNYIITVDNFNSDKTKNLTNESESTSYLMKSSIENENSIFENNNIKNDKEIKQKTFNSNKKKVKKCNYLGIDLLWIIIFILITGILTFETYYQYLVYLKYKNISKMVNIQLKIELNTLEIGNLFRGFIFNQTQDYNGENIENAVQRLLNNFYDINQNLINQLIKQLKKFPSLRRKYNAIYYSNLCNYTYDFFLLTKYNKSCEEFTSNTISNGFNQAITFYIEILRSLYTIYRNIRNIRIKFNFTYNLTLLGTQYENNLIPENNNLKNLYFISHPFFIFNNKNAAVMNCIYTVILFPVFEDLYLIMRNETHTKKYLIKFYFIPLIICGTISFFLFVFEWKRYELKLNEIIFKTKKMLIIIPIETLMKIKNIKSILGIEEENSEKKNIKWSPVIPKWNNND